MNITILTYLESETTKEYDAVVEQVAAALRAKTHEVSILGIHGDVRKLLSGLERRKPDLVFNLMEMFGENVLGDVDVAGMLDLMGVHHTGGGPGEVYLQQDKALTKKLLAFEKILYPDFAVFSQDADLETGGKLRMPLIVKPLRMDASIGIDASALVHTAPEMMKRILAIHKDVNDSALVEEYIEGREFYVSVIGNASPIALPPIEMDFSGLPPDAPRVLDKRAKWNPKSKEFKGTRAVVADVPAELRAKLHRVSIDAYRALRVRDYGRIDLRLTPTNDVYVIEVNASCYLEESAEFAMAARAGGIEYADLVDRIASLAHERHVERDKRTAR